MRWLPSCQRKRPLAIDRDVDHGVDGPPEL
jgi:hypothetical protein